MSDEAMLRGPISVIREARTFGVISHVDPDGDAVGSLIASILFLKSLGKEVFPLQTPPIPDIYDFLPGYPLLAISPNDAPRLERKELDCIIVLDCPNLTRLAWDHDEASLPSSVLVNIDHHKDNVLFGAEDIVDGRASSTAELLFGLIDAFGLANDIDIGTNIYTAISTDTGSFSYSNTTPESLRIAARLVEAGVDVAHITRHLQCDFDLSRLIFLGEVLSSARSTSDGSIVWLVGTEQMRKQAGFTGSTEQFSNYAMRVRSAQVGLLFLEEGEGRYKASIRSRGLVDAGILAARFGGGGHERAAGCRLEGDLEEIVARMVRAIEDGLEQATASDRSVL